MSEFNLIKCPDFLDNAVSPLAKEIGSTLANVVFTVFYPINQLPEKLRIKQAKNLKEYEINIDNEISKIPEKNLIEPPLNIVGPALESSKYYIENKKMRKMFAKLIASSMNIEKTEMSHPSFIEIIKQIDLVDARIIDNLKEGSPLPYAETFIQYPGKDVIIPLVEPYVRVDNLEIDYLISASSLKNLHRLGLIYFMNISRSCDDPCMKSLLNSNVFNHSYKLQDEYKDNNLSPRDGEIKFKTGEVSLTSLGSRFSKVCL